MNFLDIRTVLFSSIITSAICAMVMVSLWLQNRRRSPELVYWLADFILQFLALLLIALRGILPDVFSLLLSVPFSLLGALLMFIGLERYVEKTSSQRYNFILLAVFALAHIYFIFVQPSLPARNINFSVGLLVYCGQCAWLLLSRVASEMRPDTKMVGAIFTTYSLVSILRIFVDLTVSQNNDLFKLGLYDTLAILIYQILLICLSFVLFLLVNRHLFAELNRDIVMRKLAEEALKKSQEKLSIIFHNIPDAIVITSVADGKIIEVNEGLFRIAGFTVEESVGKTTIDLNLWGNLADRGQLVGQLNKYGQVLNFETEFRKKSGELFSVQISSELIQLLGQACILNVIQNVTARKQTEDALKESEANFRALVENAGEGILIAAQAGAHLFANRAIAEITGYSVDELLNLKVQELSHPDEASKVTHRLQDKLAGKLVPNQYETALLSKDGRKIPVEVNSNETTWRGQPVAIVFVKDITERKQAEEKLLASEIRYRRLFEAARDGILILDAETGVVVDVNPFLIEMLGFSQEEIRGKELWELGFFKDIAANKANFEELQQKGYIRYEDLPLETENGRRFHVEFVSNVYQVGHHKVIQCNIRDITARKHAEEAQQQSEIMFRTLFELSPDAIILLDPHNPNISSPIVDCNAAACLMNGYRRDELIGQPVDILNADPYTPAGQSAYLQNLRDAGNLKLEVFHHHKSGVIFPVEVSTTIIKVGGRELVIGIDRDITERKRTEERLGFQANLLANITDVVYATDLQSQLTMWNRAAEKTYGWTEEEVLGKNVVDVVNSKFDPGLRAILTQKLLASGSVTAEIEHRTRSGKTVLFESNTILLRDVDGKATGFVSVNRDITERKRVENELRVSEERYRSLFENMLNGFAYCQVLFDQGQPQDFIYLDVNRAFETLTGLKDVVGKKVSEVIPGILESDQELIALYGRVALTGAPEVIETYVEALKMWFSISVYSPQKEYFVAVFDVITERKQAEEALKEYSSRLEVDVAKRTRELREAQEKLVRQERLAMLGQLAGSVSHELRNPLGVISNAVYFLEMAQPDANAKVKEYLGIIEKETRTADKIITDLLNFSRIKSAERAPVSVADLLKQVLERYPVPESVRVTFKIPKNLPPIYVDPGQMTQVLGNLLVNACQAITGSGKLTLSAVQKDDLICIAVKDTGEGILPENIKKVFEPLFSTKAKGIGLGLAICRNLVEANDGRIEVQSEEGKGSIFSVYLPVYREVV